MKSISSIKNKKIIFLGYFCDNIKHKDSILSNADNFAQLGYMKAISQISDNVSFISTNNVLSKSSNYFDDVSGRSVLFIGYNNKFSKFLSLYLELKKHKDAIVIYYNELFIYNIVCYMLFKKKILKYVPIVITDPYEIKGAGILRNVIYNFQRKLSEKILSSSAGEIVITSMIGSHCSNSVVINGGIDEKILEKYNSVKKIKNKFLTIVYTGAIYYRYNLDIIIKAINNYDGDIKFFIYGTGDDVEKIKKMQNDRVFYCGCISRDELVKVQKNADVLVAILNNDELSHKTFPSKIFEYLVTGNEVIISNLDVVNDDIKKYCHVVKKIDEVSILSVLEDISIKNIKRNVFGLCYNVIRNNYTWNSCSQKICDLINAIKE